MPGYYTSKLAAERLHRCYEIAPPRVRQYLQAEIDHVLDRIHPGDSVLELGCGYGRILCQVAAKAGLAVGVDTSQESLRMGLEYLQNVERWALVCMDAARLAFADGTFDLVLCLQNGISAFKCDPLLLVSESLRVTRPGGEVLLSSYAAGFWEDRLHWFRLQSAEGLVGPIDEAKTGDGVIVCTDGFTARTFSADDFRVLAAQFDVDCSLFEVDSSSLFCELTERSTAAR